jgi:hypothetical protein
MPPKRNKFNIEGQPAVKVGVASKGSKDASRNHFLLQVSRMSHSQRYRYLIDRAEKELEAKVLELQVSSSRCNFITAP